MWGESLDTHTSKGNMQMKRDIVFVLSVFLLAFSEIVAYNLGAERSLNECKDDILIRDVQMKSMLAIERRLRHKGIKLETPATLEDN